MTSTTSVAAFFCLTATAALAGNTQKFEMTSDRGEPVEAIIAVSGRFDHLKIDTSNDTSVTFHRHSGSELIVRSTYKGKRAPSLTATEKSGSFILSLEDPPLVASEDLIQQGSDHVNIDQLREMAPDREDMELQEDGTLVIGGFFQIGPGVEADGFRLGPNVHIGRSVKAEVKFEVFLPRDNFAHGVERSGVIIACKDAFEN